MAHRAWIGLLAALSLLGLFPDSALAGIHTWDVSEVFSSAGGTSQFSNTTAVDSPTNLAGQTSSVVAAIAPGLVSDFQDGTLQNWSGGSNPTNIATGGPAGVGDRYLQISASSSFLGTFNKVQWSGNYIAAAIDHIDMNLKNNGPNAVAIRIMLLTPGCDLGGTSCTAWTSTTATPVASGSGWISASFSVKEANLTRVLGSQSYNTSLSNVERILIRHDDGAPSPPTSGVFVSATLGIDNVLPEPSLALGLAAGAAMLGGLCHRRRRRRG